VDVSKEEVEGDVASANYLASGIWTPSSCLREVIGVSRSKISNSVFMVGCMVEVGFCTPGALGWQLAIRLLFAGTQEYRAGEPESRRADWPRAQREWFHCLSAGFGGGVEG
jgi:hypothetical protein